MNQLKAPVCNVLARVLVLVGCTWEFASMVGYIKKMFPHTHLIVVGFSLGGNIVCKFLGENRTNQERVLCCVSVCQGYSALRWATVLRLIYTLCKYAKATCKSYSKWLSGVLPWGYKLQCCTRLCIIIATQGRRTAILPS